MPFSFKLQKVLDFRSQLEDEAMQALAKAKLILEKEELKEAKLWVEIQENKAKLVHSADLESAERWLIQTYIIAVELDIQKSKKLQRDMAHNISLCQQDLVNKSQDRQLLDKLKEKQNKQYIHEQKISEQRQYDETATIHHKKTTW